MLLAFLDGIQGTDGTSPTPPGQASEGERLRQGIAYAASKEFTLDVIGGRLLLANLLRRLGQADVARTEYEKTHALAVEAGHHLVADDCQIALADLAATTTAQSLARNSKSAL